MRLESIFQSFKNIEKVICYDINLEKKCRD